MGFGHPDRVLWDYWTVEHAGPTWLYALSAPRGPDPHARHDQARIDVQSSRDLRDWARRGVALEPGAPGSWDDLALWAGSAAAHPAGGWAMLHAGRSRAEGGRVQRVGLGRSDDLLTWRKHPGPVLEADPAPCRTEAQDGSANWRDPWLRWDRRRGLWEAWPADSRCVHRAVRQGAAPCFLGTQGDGTLLGEVSDPVPSSPEAVRTEAPA